MNQLNVSLQHSIATLAAKSWSARKIARELGVHRETVGRYLQLLSATFFSQSPRCVFCAVRLSKLRPLTALFCAYFMVARILASTNTLESQLTNRANAGTLGTNQATLAQLLATNSALFQVITNAANAGIRRR